MSMELHFENLDSEMMFFYVQARQSFWTCVGLKENAYLKDELEIELADIQIIDKYVNIKLWKAACESYLIEVCLELSDGSREIGRYMYVMNKSRIGIDDSLVLY